MRIETGRASAVVVVELRSAAAQSTRYVDGQIRDANIVEKEFRSAENRGEQRERGVMQKESYHDVEVPLPAEHVNARASGQPVH